MYQLAVLVTCGVQAERLHEVVSEKLSKGFVCYDFNSAGKDLEGDIGINQCVEGRNDRAASEKVGEER